MYTFAFSHSFHGDFNQFPSIGGLFGEIFLSSVLRVWETPWWILAVPAGGSFIRLAGEHFSLTRSIKKGSNCMILSRSFKQRIICFVHQTYRLHSHVMLANTPSGRVVIAFESKLLWNDRKRFTKPGRILTHLMVKSYSRKKYRPWKRQNL